MLRFVSKPDSLTLILSRKRESVWVREQNCERN
jgi:hypothetical protein